MRTWPPTPDSATNRRVVYETLRRKVLTLELPPGAALSENELAAALGVSRTPVRESLILLAEEGLVQVFPQVGSFVSRVDPARVADAQFLREAVELAALDDLPAELDPDVVAELRRNLDAAAAPGIDLEEFFELDEAFHQGLLRLSGHGAPGRRWSRPRGTSTGRAGSASTRPPGDVRRPARRDLPRGPRPATSPLARDAMRTHLRAVFDDIERIRRALTRAVRHRPGSVPVRRNVVVWE